VYDLDGDGVISPEEWLLGESARKAFAGMDTDGDGKISRDEWIMKFGNADMYDQYDLDGDGMIDPAEWIQGETTRRLREQMERNKPKVATAQWREIRAKYRQGRSPTKRAPKAPTPQSLVQNDVSQPVLKWNALSVGATYSAGSSNFTPRPTQPGAGRKYPFVKR